MFIIRDVFLPSVYDALLVIRRRCYFRDGRVIQNYTANFRQYFIQVAFNDGYLFGLIHLMPANYSSCCSWLARSTMFQHLGQKILFGFAPVFLLIKSYASCLVGELSQLCYKAILRTIAFGSTQCLCTWRSLSLICLEPVIVGVGRIALGRIFNVVGSIIDRYMVQSNSCQYIESNFLSIYAALDDHLITLAVWAKGICGTPMDSNNTHQINFDKFIIGVWNTLIISKCLCNKWIYYIGYSYWNGILARCQFGLLLSCDPQEDESTVYPIPRNN